MNDMEIDTANLSSNSYNHQSLNTGNNESNDSEHNQSNENIKSYLSSTNGIPTDNMNPGDGRMDPNEEMRMQFLKMFQEYANMAEDQGEKERRLNIMNDENLNMKENPHEATRMFSHHLGNLGPGEDSHKKNSKPLEKHEIHHGHDESRVEKNFRGSELEEGNRRNIKFVRGNVHISKFIMAKMEKQHIYLKKIGLHDQQNHFTDNVPGLDLLGEEQKELFKDYHK